MKIKNTLFSWLITCIGGSILLLLGIFLLDGGSENLLGNTTSEGALVVLVYGTVGSLLFSIPAFILHHLLGMLLYRNAQDRTIAKVVLSFYAALTPLLSLWLLTLSFTGERDLFQRGGDSKVLYLLLPYMICFVACVWLFGKKQTDETIRQPIVAEEDRFPHEIVTALALIIIITEVWSVFGLVQYWRFFPLREHIISILTPATLITALVLLLLRKNAGWYVLAVLTTCFVLSSMLNLGYAFTRKPDYLQAYYNFSWIFFFVLEILQLVLLMLPAVRRYFRITPEKLGVVIIGGVLLAAALFFLRL